MLSPKTVAVPPDGEINPNNIRMVVVLPEPFGPTKPQIEPSGTTKFPCDSAARSPYIFVKSEAVIAAFSMVAPYLLNFAHDSSASTLGIFQFFWFH